MTVRVSINIITICMAYLFIGMLIHNYTEPHLKNRSLRRYTIHNWVVLLMDLFLWLPLGIIILFKILLKKAIS